MRSAPSEGGTQPIHSLAFRVMRLCRPSLHVDSPINFALDDLDPSATPESPCASAEEYPFANRVELGPATNAFGVNGLMVLPQSFGTIYLGETFSSYISVGNYSDHAVTAVQIKAQLQTERQTRTTLFDNTANHLSILPSNGRHDFIVEHDLKELGQHTLVCSTVYIDSDQERKYLPQYFKFVVANPLSVRTKVRHLMDHTLLEACIENCTRNPLFLSTVRFEPSAAYTVTPIE
ncbi:peptidyl-prolyl cis-trans isomerase precursor, partial [Cymbomonas tetramitiformis]|eukprot:gene24000-29120_t